MTAVTATVTATLYRARTALEIKLAGAPATRSGRRYSRTVVPILMEVEASQGDVWGVTVFGPVAHRDGTAGQGQPQRVFWSWRAGEQIPGWVKEIVISQATAAGLQVSRLDGQDA